MKKIFLKIAIASAISFFLIPAFGVFADSPQEYHVLAPLPGIADKAGDTTTLEKYLPAIFKLAIGLSAVAAVLMIVYGGFQYITTDAIQQKQEGKARIKNAIIGLVLVISAWLILYTINPDLMTINLNVEQATTSAPPGTQTVNGVLINLNTRDQLLAQNQASALLTGAGFEFSSSGNCSDRTNRNCTSVDRIHSDTVDGLIALKTTCGTSCDQLFISGGTETGHACSDPSTCLSHESGFKADISYRQGDGDDFKNFIGQQVQAQNKTTMTTNGFYNITVGGFTYQVHPEADHMDITVIPKTNP